MFGLIEHFWGLNPMEKGKAGYLSGHFPCGRGFCTSVTQYFE